MLAIKMRISQYSPEANSGLTFENHVMLFMMTRLTKQSWAVVVMPLNALDSERHSFRKTSRISFFHWLRDVNVFISIPRLG